MKLRSILLLLLLFSAANASAAFGQAAQASNDPLYALPTSDVVGFMDLKRIVTEIVPRVLARDPATLLKLTSAVNEVKTKTGLNILSIDRVAAGLQFVGPATHQMKKENLGLVIIIHGDIDADAFLSAVKRETKGKVLEESYGGKTIHREPPPAPPSKKSERELAAFTILDANTLVVGDLPQVRATIDAASGKGRADSALVQLAARDSNALIGLAGNVPPELIKDIQSGASNDPKEQAISKLIANIKQLFISFGATPENFGVTTGARLGTPEQAQSLSDMLLGLRQQFSAEVTDQQFRDLLNSVQITATGDEVEMKAAIKTEVVQDLAASMIKENQPAPPTAKRNPPTTAAPKTKPKTTRRKRSRHKRH
ncbi:MAG: hypothetical protein M3362_24900 [Acidobacteriota bacterium]|nr:hypothetical protein [Acidobacteriota bacterium]